MKKIILAILTMALIVTGVCLLNATDEPKFSHRVDVYNVYVYQEDVYCRTYEVNNNQYPYDEQSKPADDIHVWFDVYTEETSSYYVVVSQGDRSVTADLPAWGDITVTLPEPVPPEETPETY